MRLCVRVCVMLVSIKIVLGLSRASAQFMLMLLLPIYWGLFLYIRVWFLFNLMRNLDGI